MESGIRIHPHQRPQRFWLGISLFNLCVVATLGFTLRSKAIFPLRFIDYNLLLEAHEHFALGAWVTLVLMVLVVYELLPQEKSSKNFYKLIFIGITVSSWLLLAIYLIKATASLQNTMSAIFMLVTYFFTIIFIKNIRRTSLHTVVKWLSISSVICLVISSAGPITIAYLFEKKYTNAIIYKDALYTYLHFQYNGFFTLAVFALLFNRMGQLANAQLSRSIQRFSFTLILSVVPSLFITFLWVGSNTWFLIISALASILLLFSLIFFFPVLKEIVYASKFNATIVRFVGLVYLLAFMLKILLQSLTIFPRLGTAVFGNRALIIGFLHLVFLGFVSLFVLNRLYIESFISASSRWSRFALLFFALAVIFNETILMIQGLGAMFIKSSQFFPQLLWLASLFLLLGAVFVFVAFLKSKASLAPGDFSK